MSYVILITNPSNGRVMAIADDNDAQQLRTFRTYDDAEAEAEHHDICRVWPYAIIEAP